MDCGSYINHIRVDRSFIPYCGVNLQIAIMYKLARSILAINLINLLSSVSLLGGSYDHLKVGDKAPDFEAIVVRGDEEKKVLRLSDYKGQNVVIVFYFMDNTPYCTSQMKSLKERYDELEERGYVVDMNSMSPKNDNAGVPALHEPGIVVFTDGSVRRGQKSGWAFSARVDGRITEEQSGAYKCTTSSMAMEVKGNNNGFGMDQYGSV